MDRRETIKTLALGAFGSGALLKHVGARRRPPSFVSDWHRWPDVRWAGPDVWGNRLQDWRIRDGAVECTARGPGRTLHCLTHRLKKGEEPFEVSVKVESMRADPAADAYAGFRLGATGPFDDYRSAAVFGEGLEAGLRADGVPFVGDTRGGKAVEGWGADGSPVRLRLRAEPQGSTFTVVLDVLGEDASAEEEAPLAHLAVEGVAPEALVGNVALVSHGPEGEEARSGADAGAPFEETLAEEDQPEEGASDDQAPPVVRFSRWQMDGPKLLEDLEAVFGPVMFAQYTLHRGTLKLTAQLAPVERIDGVEAVLEVREDGAWQVLGRSAVDPLARIARFRVEDWEREEAVPYRVRLTLPLGGGTKDFFYEGTLAREPAAAEEPLKVAVFSCNADHGFPDADVVQHVQQHQPDAAVFLGDQYYEGSGGFGIQRGPVEEAALDMLHKWYMFGWSYRDIYRDIPSAVIPDDHDVYHGNVWGEGGADAPVETEGWGYGAQDAGGYKMPPTWVNVMQRAQTSHLPDPYDPTPVKQGIGVYYTDWLYGGVSFALLEDRKFKSPPQEVLPEEAQVTNGFITNPAFDIREHPDAPGANLLGERQLRFLRDWAEDWSAGAQMKAVLSQTNFCAAHTLPEGSTSDQMVPGLRIPPPGEYIEGDAPVADMDTNGWPRNRRDEAVRLLRSCQAFHIAGDQHLATVLRYGVDAFDDAGFAFTGPALNNIWPRRWWPSPERKQKDLPSAPAYAGSFFDAFGNRMTLHAAANPRETGLEPSIIYDRVTGYGMVTFDTQARTVHVECWPRHADPETDPQYDGWPMTVAQADGDGREAAAYLPELDIAGLAAPVIQVVHESTDETLYTLRAPTPAFRPKVFQEEGHYTVRVGDGERWLETLQGLEPLPAGQRATRTIQVASEQ